MPEQAILEALTACHDPGNPFAKPANLVELGCVASLTLTLDNEAPGAGIRGVPDRYQLALTLLPTSTDVDARAQLRAQVLNALAGIQQLSRTHLNLAEGWTEARLTSGAAHRLRPPPFAILNIANEQKKSRPHPRPTPRTHPPLRPRLRHRYRRPDPPRRARHRSCQRRPHYSLLCCRASILDACIGRWLLTKSTFSIDRYTFLDVGAGKGRALLQASLHPFEQAIGIELNPTLAAIARANLKLFGAAASQLAPVSLVEADALEAPLPETPTLAFLFHPFEAPVLRRFLARCALHFRTLDILYVNAEHAEVFDRNPALPASSAARSPCPPSTTSRTWPRSPTRPNMAPRAMNNALFTGSLHRQIP